MSSANDLTADVDIDVAGLVSEVWKKRWLVLALTVLAGAAIFVLTLFVDSRYSSSARILIEKRESVFTRPTAGDSSLDQSQFDEQAIGSQVQILTSDDIALKVITSLGLDKTSEFGAPKSALGDILGLFGLGGETNGPSPAERSLKTFKQHLTIFAAEKSRVLVVEFWARDPELAQKVPNAIAEEYLKLTKQAKIQSNTEATQWLGPEIEDLRAKVRAAEAKVAAFRSNSDILDSTNNSLLATQQLSEVSTQLSQLRSQRAAAEARADSIRAALGNGASLDTVPEVIASPLIQRLRERQVALQAEISDLSTTLLSSHPKLKALRSQLGDFDRQIRSEARNILKGLQNNAEVLRTQEIELNREVSRLKAEAARVGEAEVELRALEREAAAQRDLLQTYLTQYREAASRQNSEYLPVDARIISRAIRPVEPYFPKIIPMVGTAMMTMLVLSIVGILTWELMSGRAFRRLQAYEGNRVPERLEVPDLYTAEEEPQRSHPGRGPDIAAAPAGIGPAPVFEKPSVSLDEHDRLFESELPEVDSPSIDPDFEPETGEEAAPRPLAVGTPETFEFRLACEAIEKMETARIAVVSPAGDPGSMTAVLLARELARNGKSVAIVDLTGSGVTTRHMLGEGRFSGLRELLAGKIRFAESVHRDTETSAQVLPTGTLDETVEGIDIGRLVDVTRFVADTYDFQVYDCGYAGTEGLKLVADVETIVIISCEGASNDECADMVGELAEAGFTDAILVRLEQADREAALAGAAA